MLSADFEPPIEGEVCSCCGGRTTRLVRFVYQDGDAYAVYHAQYSDNHPKRLVLATVSIGGWGEGATPQDRVAFALELRTTRGQFEVMVLSAEDSPWRESQVLGHTLDREPALKHPRIGEVFAITDFMVSEDLQLRQYLEGKA